MKKEGRTYFLNRKESLTLQKNDRHPDQEVLRRRAAFLAEIDERIVGLHMEENGSIVSQPKGIDEAALLQALRRREASAVSPEGPGAKMLR